MSSGGGEAANAKVLETGSQMREGLAHTSGPGGFDVCE